MKKQFSQIAIAIIFILFITVSLSYAYFTANLSGIEETTTITVTGGSMNIYYNGGSVINLNNIYPKDEKWVTKTFTITGNNTTNIDMNYQINLVIEENTFSEQALKYKLISSNTNNNGYTAPSINELTNIGTGAKIINLGVGSFKSPTSGNKTHTYNLELYFPNLDYVQNEDQGKLLRLYIDVTEEIELFAMPEYYVEATDEDFTLVYHAIVDSELMLTDNIYLYTGADDYVIIPEMIDGNLVTSAFGMFGRVEDNDWNLHYASQVKGVATINSNITNMGWMFLENKSPNLELLYLDTSNVTNMINMFMRCEASMLDLSFFDTSKVIKTFQMFYQSKTSVGYARTQDDANKFNSSSNKPAGLNFIVK